MSDDRKDKDNNNLGDARAPQSFRDNSYANRNLNVNKRKIVRIKRELDQLVKGKHIKASLVKDATESEREIHNRNEQLIDNVYRYNRQHAKELVSFRRDNITLILTIVVGLLLVVAVTIGIFLYLQRITSYEEDYVKIDIEMTNKDIFYTTDVSNSLIPKKISPGDTYNLNIVTRNGNTGGVSGNGTTIYLRFKIFLIVDGVEYPEYVYIKPDDMDWEKYDKSIEDTYENEEGEIIVKDDDGYYYCKQVLWPNDEITLIDSIRFSETNLTQSVANKELVLKVVVEAIEAWPNTLINRDTWVTAPQHWTDYMIATFPDTGVHNQNDNSSLILIIVFASISVVLTALLLFLTTRKRKATAKKQNNLKIGKHSKK